MTKSMWTNEDNIKPLTETHPILKKNKNNLEKYIEPSIKSSCEIENKMNAINEKTK